MHFQAGNVEDDGGHLREITHGPTVIVGKTVPGDMGYGSQEDECADPRQASQRQERKRPAEQPKFGTDRSRQEEHERPFEKAMKRNQYREPRRNAEEHQTQGRMADMPQRIREEDIVGIIRGHASYHQR